MDLPRYFLRCIELGEQKHSFQRTTLADTDLDLQLQDIFHHVVSYLKHPTTPVQGNDNVPWGVNISIHYSTQNNSATVLLLIYGAEDAC